MLTSDSQMTFRFVTIPFRDKFEDEPVICLKQ